MKEKFPEHEYYIRKQDSLIPESLGSENIILTLKGMQEIANYYEEKYGIDIIPFNSTMSIAPELISRLISQAREKASHYVHYKCAFIFNNVNAGEHGHAMPMIWEKNGLKESMFFLDTGQFLGDTSFLNYDCDFIELESFDENIPLSSLPGSANNAYILTNDNLFYIQKAENMIVEPLVFEDIFGNTETINTEKLNQVKDYINKNNQNLPRDKTSLKLSWQHFIEIQKITGFNINRKGQEALTFRQELMALNPDLELYSNFGYRQVDLSSCTTDALSVCKDALRIDAPLTEIAKQKEAKQVGDVKLFYMPEELLKTAQIGSFPEKSKANPDKFIHMHKLKDPEGKYTGDQIPFSLAEFRKRYDVPVEIKGNTKQFGGYTIHKGESFSKILRERWEKNYEDQLRSSSKRTQDYKNDLEGIKKQDQSFVSTLNEEEMCVLKHLSDSYKRYETVAWDYHRGHADAGGFLVDKCVTDPDVLKSIITIIQTGLSNHIKEATDASLLLEKIYNAGFQNELYKDDIKNCFKEILASESIESLNRGVPMMDVLLSINKTDLTSENWTHPNR